jgi:signal transduction histidine kinase
MLPPNAVNILLVDDHPASLTNYEALLKDTGENLILANSAQEALEQVLTVDVAVVVINLSMRGSNGLELCKTIQQHPDCQSTSILLISANPVTDSDCFKAYPSGTMDYLSLPLVPELLRAKVALFARLYRNANELEKLRNSARRKNHFLDKLAHELRNPLAPIASAAMVLRKKAPLDKDFQWISEVIERQVVSLKKLVDDLLDISRISQNRLVLQRERVDLASILNAAAKTARPAIKQHGHQFSLKLPKKPVYVFADPIRLTQVFENLLDNSAKFTNPGGRISLVAELEGDSVAIRLTDNGISIDVPEDEMSLIAEPFYQSDSSSTKPQSSLGVGLSLVWQLVDMHEGSVEVSSGGAGKGREFIVHLPALVELPLVTGPAESLRPASNLRILIAEDNRDSAATLAMSLRLHGHIVEIAYDGNQALEIAETFRPHVALLDIEMPGVRGYEVARRIRSLDWSKGTFLIAQTGWGRPEDWEKAVVAGFNSHLTKPLDYDALTKILDSYINHFPEVLLKPAAGPLSGNQALSPKESNSSRATKRELQPPEWPR